MPELQRDVLPIPDPQHVGVTTYDAKDPGHVVPADRAAQAAGGRAERARDPDRRRRLRLLVGLRRPLRDAELRTARGQGAALQPLPHDRALLSDPAGTPHRAQPPRRRHGRHHRDRDLGARLQLDPAEGGRAARGDAEAERLLDGAVRQVPRGAGLGDEPDGAVPRLADAAAASSTSTASSAARRTSTRRRSTRTRCPSSPTARRRRATTSPRT